MNVVHEERTISPLTDHASTKVILPHFIQDNLSGSTQADVRSSNKHGSSNWTTPIRKTITNTPIIPFDAPTALGSFTRLWEAPNQLATQRDLQKALFTLNQQFKDNRKRQASLIPCDKNLPLHRLHPPRGRTMVFLQVAPPLWNVPGPCLIDNYSFQVFTTAEPF